MDGADLPRSGRRPGLRRGPLVGSGRNGVDEAVVSWETHALGAGRPNCCAPVPRDHGGEATTPEAQELAMEDPPEKLQPSAVG